MTPDPEPLGPNGPPRTIGRRLRAARDAAARRIDARWVALHTAWLASREAAAERDAQRRADRAARAADEAVIAAQRAEERRLTGPARAGQAAAAASQGTAAASTALEPDPPSDGERRPSAPGAGATVPAVDSIGRRLRTRLLPALLTALGVALLAGGLLSYTSAVEPAPTARALASYEPLPTVDTAMELPTGSGLIAAASFPPDRVATRVVIRRMGIDLPVMLQTANYGIYPLCDVAMYLRTLGQPGEGRATYIYAHARPGMFLPLLNASKVNNGQRMIGMTVEVYTSDSWKFIYTVTEVRRHTRNLNDAVAATTERLWLQTSEGPEGTVPKLQVVADFLSAEKADPVAAHPAAHPRICG